MTAGKISGEERVGLVLAVVLHAGLFAALLLGPGKVPVPKMPDRITVTISDDVGLTSTAPQPAAQPAPDIAPQIGEAQPVPAPALPEPPQPVVKAAAPPPLPQPRTAAPPKPVAPAKPATSAAKPAEKPAKPKAPAGANRIGRNFLEGVASADTAGTDRTPSAATISAAVRSSIGSAIARQLKPNWSAPQGADAELLITLVRFRLARDGSLIGDPEVVAQTGDTPANVAQKRRHAEQAIRAVRLSAPFDLPAEYYSAWQTVTSRFDKRLSQ